MSQTIPDFDVREDFLEDHWDDEAKCVGGHERICLVSVSYRATSTCDNDSVLWCLNRYLEHVDDWGKVACEVCKQPTEDCWVVIPV